MGWRCWTTRLERILAGWLDVTDIGDCCFIAFNACNEISGVQECKLLELQQDLQLFNNVASFIASLLKEVQSL